MLTHRGSQIAATAVLFCFASVAPPLGQDDLPALVKRIQPSTVVILTYDREGTTRTLGSGFFISQDGDIVTNGHVLRGAVRPHVKITQSQVFPIKYIVAEDKEGDIVRATVEISSKTVSAMQISTSSVEVGERIVVIGSPLGLEQTVSDGIVSAVRQIPAFGKIIQITAPISPGSSGSPVVNMRGEVIGVATLQIAGGQNLNFAIPSERIAKLAAGKGKSLAGWQRSPEEEWLASAEGLYHTGMVFLWRERYDEALPYFDKAVKKNPRYAQAHFQIGFCKRELGRHEEALEAYKEAIRIKPDYAEAHLNLGLTYHGLGRYGEAIEAYKQAIRIKPDDAQAHLNSGYAYGIDDRGQAQVNLVIAYVKLGRDQEAIEPFKEAIRIKPHDATAHLNLGVTYHILGRHQEAIEACKEAIRIKPDYAAAHLELGGTYRDLGREQEAIEACKQAIRIKPDFTAAHHDLGLLYLIVGDKSSALDEYKILRGLDKNSANELFNLIYK